MFVQYFQCQDKYHLNIVGKTASEEWLEIIPTHVSGFIVRIYHDTLSPERQKRENGLTLQNRAVIPCVNIKFLHYINGKFLDFVRSVLPTAIISLSKIKYLISVYVSCDKGYEFLCVTDKILRLKMVNATSDLLLLL